MTLIVHTTREQVERLFPIFAKMNEQGEWEAPNWLLALFKASESKE